MMAAAVQRCVFDVAADLKLTAGLREVSRVQNHQETLHVNSASAVLLELHDDRKHTPASAGEVSDRMLCSTCQCMFQSREEQMEHYKLDWHRFNLRQRLSARAPITVDEFEKKTGAGDVSSISGSDSDDEADDCGDESMPGGSGFGSGRVGSRLLLQNSQGQFVSLYRCVLQARRAEGDVSLCDSLLELSNSTVWLILMSGGGHFAGAVFKGKEMLQHKTFHRYTVRAKRGTAQGIRDAQSRGHAPKSAGSALRRYNEAALVKDIQEVLRKWAEHLKEAAAIFLRTPKYNRSVFFSGRGAPLEKHDSRIRSLPFATRRATLSEIQRVYELLSTAHVYDAKTDISDILSPVKRVWQKERKSLNTTTLPNTNPNVAVSSTLEEDEERSSADESSEQLEMVDVTLDLLDLREHEVKPGKRRRHKRKEKKTQRREDSDSRERMEEADVADDDVAAALVTQESSEKKVEKSRVTSRTQDCIKVGDQRHHTAGEVWDWSVRDALFTACKTGDVATLRTLLQSAELAGNPSSQGDKQNLLRLLNSAVDLSGFTLLHVAAAAGRTDAVRVLLDAGSDPTCRNRKGQTPYAVAADKHTRNTFRRYMAENPNKHDYAKAQVPGPLTDEIESKKAEKKKAQKAARRQREREQQEERGRQQQEEEGRRMFLALSDREKRALAAERRLAQQAAGIGATHTNVRRCCQCGESLLGKVPFEYVDLSFCSPRCVQTHRSAAALQHLQNTQQPTGCRK